MTHRIEGGNRLCRLALHDFETVRDTDATIYYQCRRCGERKAIRRHGAAHQPIDRHWLATGEWALPLSNPPHGGSNVKPPKTKGA